MLLRNYIKAWLDPQNSNAYMFTVNNSSDNSLLIYWLTLQQHICFKGKFQQLLVLTKEPSKEIIEKYHLKPEGKRLYNHFLFFGLCIMEENHLHFLCHLKPKNMVTLYIYLMMHTSDKHIYDYSFKKLEEYLDCTC